MSACLLPTRFHIDPAATILNAANKGTDPMPLLTSEFISHDTTTVSADSPLLQHFRPSSHSLKPFRLLNSEMRVNE
jgi:hypothetical protein